jgi:hypothetical protein
VVLDHHYFLEDQMILALLVPQRDLEDQLVLMVLELQVILPNPVVLKDLYLLKFPENLSCLWVLVGQGFLLYLRVLESQDFQQDQVVLVILVVQTDLLVLVSR